jgi:D-glycero-D-manno-heptose 1,7-bisphosphate phosphatase
MSGYTYSSMENAGIMVSNDISREYSSILFLDRDGVIIKDVGHISKKEDVELVHGIDRLIKRSREAGMLVVVVTNQASVARRIISQKEYIEITNHMISMLGDSMLDMIISSFFHPMFSENTDNSSWRKPRAGMFRFVLERCAMDANKCIMIGDRPSDIIAAERVGIQTSYLLKTNRYAEEITFFEADPRQAGAGVRIISCLEDVELTNG